MLTLSNVLGLILLLLLIYISSKLFTKTPIPNGLKELPGSSGWPLVGNFFSVKEPLWSHLYKLSKKYGPIFTFTMGCRKIIIFSSNKVLSEAFRNQAINFSGRWDNILIKTVNHDSGVIFKDKEWWATQRSFVLKVLKDFGLGKKRSEEIVNYECAILIKDIEDECGKAVSARSLFPKSMVNIISKLVMNMRFERDSKNFKLLTSIIESITQNRNWFVTLILMYPMLENFTKFSKFLFWCSGRIEKSEFQYKFIKEIVDDHKKRFNVENEGEDLIDIFLKEQYKLNENNVKDHTFTDWQLIRVGIELFIAGYETTSTTLIWSMLMLSKNPKIQDKVYQEILNIIGTERIPSLSDKKSMHYTQAVMDEVFRFSSVVPLSIPHRVFQDTQIDGYFIPKNSIIFPNLYACHRDPDIWERPFEFYPEHFLKTSENGEIKYTARDDLVPFSIGKRQCLGEALARMEFFMFLTSIIQRFKVRFEKEISEEEFSKIIRGTDGGIRAPLNSDVVFEMRL